jgi:RarD protein
MKETQKENNIGSVIRMAGAMLIFGTIGIFRRFIPLSSAMLASVRGITGALFLLCILLFRKKNNSVQTDPRAKLSFIISGCLIGLNWMFLFEAYRYTTVGIATLCYYMQPTIVLLLSPLIFHEKLTVRKLVCALIAAAGMFLISADDIRCGNFRGIVYGLAAACLYAGVVIFNKKAPAADAYEKTVLQLFSAGVVLLPYILLGEGLSFPPLDLLSFGLLMTVCIVHTGIAYMLYFSSMAGLKAQTIALMGYIDPVSALLLSALILHEPLTPVSLCGAVMIILGALGAELQENRL